MSDKSSQSRSFEAFNARFLTSEEVARSFIPPPQYSQLVATSHTILLGPRGSGKTTLLKMLQLRALAVWNHERADEIRKSIGYQAVFLGTDVLWGSQLESRTKEIEDKEKRAQIRRTSFRLHLSLAFLNSVNECRDPLIVNHPELKRFSHPFDRQVEGLLARGLSKIWKMDEHSDSLLGVRISLQSQLAQLLAITSQLRRDKTTPLPTFVDLDPIASLLSAIDLANAVFNSPSKRWALLCDELEIAPEIIREELFRLLRSSTHNLIFKFSLFPYSSELETINDATAPQSNNDFAFIELFYGKREEAYAFCEAMLKGMISELSARPPLSPEEVLGEGWFDGGRSHRRLKSSAYAPPNGQFYVRAQRLFRVDKGFRSWLAKNKFDIREIHNLSEDSQAQYRKALPYILTRSEFLGAEGKLRSRKALNLYTGAYSMFSLSEGNPRVFINLMRPLVQEYSRSTGTISSELQSSSAEQTIHRFKSSLSAIPTNSTGDILSILQLVEIIGSYFRASQLGLDFRAEPANTFIVDPEVQPGVADLIGRALNAGAFVRMGDGPSGGRDLIGARLRLCYTLAPEYKLPLLSGRSTSLSTILHLHRRARLKYPDVDTQIRLPFGIDQ